MENNVFYCFHCMTRLPAPTEFCPHCGKPPAERSNLPHQLPEGTLLQNRYLTGCVLGQGGFGITYVGTDTRLNRRVAIKEYFPQTIVNRHVTAGLRVTKINAEDRSFETGILRFLDEARTLAMFDEDPNIVNVQDFFEENGTAYIVMEYLEGESLKSLLERRGPLPFAQVSAMLRPVMRALSGLHAKGLIHRDISPSNLMLLNNGQVKLLDFGAAREMTPEGENSLSVVFKPGYAPEEQYMTRSAQGPWSDVYSLCASIYKLITNVTPENPYLRMENETLRRPSALGADISPAAEAVLLRGMAIKRKDRIQTMEELAAAFDAAQNAPAAAGPDDEITYVSPSAMAAPKAAPAPAPEPPAAAASPELTVKVPVPGMPAAVPAEPAKPAAPSRREKGAPRAAGKAKKQRGTAAGKKKWLPAVIIAAALLLIAGMTTAVLLTQKTADLKSVTYSDETVTAESVRQILKRDSTNRISFNRCTVGDDVVKSLSSLKELQYITFSNCAGFTALTPLGACPSLKQIQLNGDEKQSIDLNAVFDGEMPNIKTLTVQDYVYVSGVSALSRFGGLQTLQLSENTFSAGEAFPAMPTVTSLDISNGTLNGLDLSAVASWPSLSSFSAINTPLPGLSFLNGSDTLSHVSVKNCGLDSLKPLQSVKNLSSLNASDNLITDLSPLAGLVKLSSLKLNRNKIEDISPLAGLTNVNSLELNENRISDITPLQGMTTLKQLSLGGNALTDLSPLRGCKEMQRLTVSHNELTNLTGCDEMIRLTELQATNNRLTDLSALSNSTQLEDVYLSDNELTDISVLAKSAAHLTSVLLDNNGLTDLSPLKNATKLYALSVNGNRLTTLSQLTGCTGLYAFSANGNQLTDISGLRDCVALYGADLGENQITDISPLNETGASVMVLLLQNNRITDINALNPLKDYKYLSLYNNAISDFSHLPAMTAVKYGDELYVSLTDRASVADLAGSDYAMQHLIDVPLDQQVEIETEYKTVRGEAGKALSARPTFQTAEEAGRDIEDVREKLRTASRVAVWAPGSEEGE